MKTKFSLLITLGVVMLSGCSTINTKQLVGGLVGGAANTQVGYDKHQCVTIKSRCVEGHYEEWQTSDGVPGCSCKNHD